MTRIIENDGTEYIGVIMEYRHSPVPYYRVRDMQSSMLFWSRPKIGFGTDIVFEDDIRFMEEVHA